MPEKPISASKAREIGEESLKLAESDKFHEVPEKEMRKLLNRLQKEPTKSVLRDHLSTFRTERPDVLPEQFDRLSHIVDGSIKYPKTSDKGIIVVFLKHFSEHVRDRTMGTVGRGNAWKDLK